MSLFDIVNYETTQEHSQQRGEVMAVSSGVFLSHEIMPNIAKAINSGAAILYYTRKGWHMVDLLKQILKNRSADVVICSYSMGEGAARQLALMKNSGTIRNLAVIIDDRTETRTAGSVQILRAICDKLSMQKVHAKITVITDVNTGESISIVGSANYTENHRLETGCIYPHKDIAQFYLNVLKEELEHERA